MGGMSAQIPIKDDVKANEVAMQKVRADKLREVTAGHDGTWIAHPLINKIAMDVFNENMLGPNQVRGDVCSTLLDSSLTGFIQYHIRREEVRVAAADLLDTRVPGQVTEEGVRENVSCALAYTAAWIGGNGCIPINYLMEDAATAEITRVQLWQWVKHGSKMASGRSISVDYVDRTIDELAPGIKKMAPGVKDEDLQVAVRYLKSQIRQTWPSEFLTSDLMFYLAKKDGVAHQWQKSAL